MEELPFLAPEKGGRIGPWHMTQRVANHGLAVNEAKDEQANKSERELSNWKHGKDTRAQVLRVLRALRVMCCEYGYS